MNQMRRPWTGEDNDKIRNLAGKVSPAEMARRLNRTEAATRAQSSKLRIALTSPANGVRHTVNKRLVHLTVSAVEQVVAPAAIERALSIYQQLQKRDQSVVAQARKILTQHIYGMVDQGERNEQRLTVGGLIHLRAVERDHPIKSAQDPPTKACV